VALDKCWLGSIGRKGGIRITIGSIMTDVNEVYLCEICGNKVKVLENGPGVLVCCGQPMTKVE
jgi:superoxide reductase